MHRLLSRNSMYFLVHLSFGSIFSWTLSEIYRPLKPGNRNPPGSGNHWVKICFRSSRLGTACANFRSSKIFEKESNLTKKVEIEFKFERNIKRKNIQKWTLPEDLKITAIYPFSLENEARFSQFDSNSQQPLNIINLWQKIGNITKYWRESKFELPRKLFHVLPISFQSQVQSCILVMNVWQTALSYVFQQRVVWHISSTYCAPREPIYSFLQTRKSEYAPPTKKMIKSPARVGGVTGVTPRQNVFSRLDVTQMTQKWWTYNEKITFYTQKKI